MNEENLNTLARILSEMSPDELRILANICNKTADLRVIHQPDWQTLINELLPLIAALGGLVAPQEAQERLLTQYHLA